MTIPSNFIIANNTINVIIEDIDEYSNYGYFSDATNEIHLFKYVKCRGEKVELTDEQMLNTFYHELMHVFQFYYNNEYNDAEAQVFANFIREYKTTAIYEN